MKIFGMGSNSSHYYKIIANNVKKLRRKNNLSQEKFAETVGCSREYISRLENNKEKISLSMILNISSIYDILPEDFFKI